MQNPPFVGCCTASTAFLTHAPFTSFDQRSRTIMGWSEVGLARPRTSVEHREHLSPFLFRRSTTTLGEDLPPIGSRLRRSKSAPRSHDYAVVMPRSHVSVARFYDWSEDLSGCVSVSQLYREIASMPRLDSRVNGVLRGSHPSLVSGVGVGWANNANNTNSNGSTPHTGASRGRGQSPQLYISPGRMFVRDKKALTRGEREIIEGIYKNRGDVGCSPRDALSRTEFQVRSHQDAWVAGKTGAASNNVEISAALGKAVMRGVGLDTNGKDETVCRPTNDDGIHSDYERSKTPGNTTNSSTNIGHKTQNRRSFRESQRRVKKYIVISESAKHQQQCCHSEQTQSGIENSKTPEDNNSKSLSAYNQPDYWDSRPSAPPCSPNHIEIENSPSFSTPEALPREISTLTKNNSDSNQSPEVFLAPDKLLAMRPSLPPNAIILAEKIRMPQSHKNSSNRQRVSNGRPSQDRSAYRNASDSNIFSDVYDERQTGEECYQNDHFFVGTDNCDDHDKKTMTVRVYLPSAETETHEDDVILTSPLAKERPLSHSSFKSRNLRLL